MATDNPSPATAEQASPQRKLFTVGTLVYTTSGLVFLFSWLLWGDFALSMRERSVGPLIEKFLLTYGASNTLKQILTATLPTAIAIVVSPIVSYRSDRLRSRWGRRIPFLLIPTPIAGLAMVGIAFCPQMGEALYLWMGNTPAPGIPLHDAASAYVLSIFTVFWTIFEVAVIISGSVFFGLINDVVPRPVLGRFHGLFRAVSLYDGILFNSLLFQYAQSHFTLMFAMIGILFGVGFTLMCLKVKEGNYPPVPEEPRRRRGFDVITATATVTDGSVPIAEPVDREGFFVRFFRAGSTYLRECFTHRYYVTLFLMFILAGLTFSPVNSFSIRYAAQLKMFDGDYGFLLAISYLVSLSLAFPLGMIVDYVHAMRASMFTMSLYLLTMLAGSLFVHDTFTFGVAFVGHTILSGTYFTCAASLGQQLYPRSKFSQYASAGGLLGSFVAMFFNPAIGAVMDATNNNYHLNFWFGFGLSLMTLILMAIIYRSFMRYGGPTGYLAPGDLADKTSQREPPKFMFQTIGFYFIGVFAGLSVGYVLAYLVCQSAAMEAGVGLGQFHTLLSLKDPMVRNWTTFCLATGVIPGAILGFIAGHKWLKRYGVTPAGGH